ncbi:pyridoxamine 5'-phosphate oxidase family protein [Streptomyces armeniacus]|uniref:Pyridoxamine 5'-phosphate oxidase family protein n=1 Tax=Streptomyces armeniacus TaxID=83291 RepID=A0A345XJ92_9ACTN|nr:pyridoxamine 5'-phosphate oxidase family protein [Streptomyces armeniacus]AXK31708.1 pyridoxamine 5'-phosphate oxidase family protein [Streptomyces armeniacus]
MPTEQDRAIELLRTTPYGRIAMSRHALPFITVARHIVAGRSVLLRLHRGFGYHRACDGNVVAYEADNMHRGGDVWAVQLVGTARLAEPGPAELARLGPPARSADAEPYAPAYLRLDPRFASVHRLTGVA